MFNPFRFDRIQTNIPYTGHLRPDAVVTDTGEVVGIIEVDGLPWETVDDSDLENGVVRLNWTLRNLSRSWRQFHIHRIRTMAPASMYPRGKFRSVFPEVLDNRYAERLMERLYVNKTFISVVIRPPEPFGSKARKAASKLMQSVNPRKKPVHKRNLVRRLEGTMATLCGDLKEYGPKILGYRTKGKAIYSEIAEAIGQIMYGEWQAYPLVAGHLGRSIYSQRIVFESAPGGLSEAGQGIGTIRIHGPRARYAAQIGYADYPAIVWPGMSNALLKAPYCYSMTHSFRPLDKSDGSAVITRKQNVMVSGGDKAYSQIAGLTDFNDRLMSNEFAMGEHAVGLTVFADSRSALREVVTASLKDIEDGGAKATLEDRSNEAAFYAALPGNAGGRRSFFSAFEGHPRSGAISTESFACLESLHGYPMGPERGYWGEPICLFRTDAGTPYRFHLQVGQSGNIRICGPTRSGKTTLLAFLANQCEKAADKQLFWDKDRGLELAVLGLGGRYYRFLNGEPTGLAPLKALDGNNPDDMEHLRQLFTALVDHGSRFVWQPEDERRLVMALEQVMDLPPEDRWIEEVRSLLGTDPAGAGARLEKWCWGNSLGWIVDCPVDTLDLSAPAIGFDQTKYLDNPDARGPINSHLFYRTDKLLDGQRVITWIDEFWKSLQDPAFRGMIHNALKTRGKLNSPMVLATQSLTDALLAADIAHTILEQCKTSIEFANPKADREAYTKRAGYTDAEFNLISQEIPAYSGMFLLKQEDKSIVSSLDLFGMDDEIAVLSGNERNVRILDEVRAEMPHEKDPVRLLTALHDKRRERIAA